MIAGSPVVRLYATLAIVSATTIGLGVLLFVVRPTRLAPNRRPCPVELDEPTGLVQP